VSKCKCLCASNPSTICALLIAASPAYLKRAGRPKTPNELPNHLVLIGPPGTDPKDRGLRRRRRKRVDHALVE
jgi:hypothetical protein